MKICPLSAKNLPPEWLGEHPVLCMAGRSLIDEAAAIMLAQLSTAHGLAARVEGAEALSTTNVLQLETTGVAIVCLVYLNSNGSAHMRYELNIDRPKRQAKALFQSQDDLYHRHGIQLLAKRGRVGQIHCGFQKRADDVDNRGMKIVSHGCLIRCSTKRGDRARSPCGRPAEA